jgi:hypothetical protein
LKTEENSNERIYCQTYGSTIEIWNAFQDYMPNIPSIKLYLNLVYNTGLPGGSPSYADPYLYQNRLNDYRRRCGFSKVLLITPKKENNTGWFKTLKSWQ